MAEYRRPDLDLSTRILLGIEMLAPAHVRGWGRAKALAEEHGVSRSTLYTLKTRMQEALETALQPRPAGRPAQEKCLRVDASFIRRAVTVMPLLTGSVRSIQTGLALLFGVQRSVGYISQTLQAAGQAAQQHHAKLKVPWPILGEADEIFARRKPCLTVVDGRSFLVLNLTAETHRDATTWGLTFLDLAAQGFAFQDVAADGARGIRAGLRDAELAVPLRPDLFHLLREGQKVHKRLEKDAYQALRLTERAQRAAREAQATVKRRGPRVQSALTVEEAQVQEEHAVAKFDHFVWLATELRQALEPITMTNQRQTPQAAAETVTTACTLLTSLADPAVTQFAQQVEAHLADLCAPLQWLAETLAPWEAQLPPDILAWVYACWQSKAKTCPAVPPQWQTVARALWEALGLFHRSSSLAEALHSWLRPYLTIHRGMPTWLLPLLQLFWNHHIFTRGKRAGQSPLQLAGVANPASVQTAFAALWAPTAA